MSWDCAGVVSAMSRDGDGRLCGGLRGAAAASATNAVAYAATDACAVAVACVAPLMLSHDDVAKSATGKAWASAQAGQPRNIVDWFATWVREASLSLHL